ARDRVAARGAAAAGERAAMHRRSPGRPAPGGPARAHAGGVPATAPRAAGDPAHGARLAHGRGDRGHRAGAHAPGGDGSRAGGSVRLATRRPEPRPRSTRPAAVMTATWPRTLARWSFALTMPAVALGIALPLSGSIDQIPSPPFVAAIFAVAWFSGFRPALLSIVISAAVIDWFFLSPKGTFQIQATDARWLAL